MRKRSRSATVLLPFALVLVAVGSAAAQSGGNFIITEATVAAGGGTSGASGVELDATAGQAVVGEPIFGDVFSLTAGFWSFTPQAPTAAAVSISGRVLTPGGVGLRNAILFLRKQDGEILVARTAAFGFYRFDGIEAGQSVFISVESKIYRFNPRLVMVGDEITALDFLPQP